MSIRLSGRISGIVKKNPISVSSYTLPSSATNLQNNNNLVDGSTPAPVITQPTVVVTETTTSFQDLPGMVSLPFRAFFVALKDLRSAATNTASAFGLDQKTSADQAVQFEKKLIADTVTAAPAASDDSVIIPP